ncbi:MAG: tetratricopeptide repeat protein, partial [Phaeodactylibacter sp.]|nr:tetratricopeptide repeat protein [Phaeodactylibacter sp.]
MMLGKKNRFNLAPLLLLFCCAFLTPTWAQVDLKTLEKDADRYFEHAKYWEALPGYQRLNTENPFDYNIKYKLAICYYEANNPEEALRLLTNLKETPRFSEDKLDYYIARCYHEKLEFREAVEYYKTYLRNIPGNKEDERTIIKDAIRHCSNGMRIGAPNSQVFVENMGERVNARGDDFRPVPSPTNANRMYFASARAGVLGGMRGENGLEDSWAGYYRSDMYFSVSEKGLWTKAEAMSYRLNSTNYDVVLGFSGNGSKMYYYQGPSLFQ